MSKIDLPPMTVGELARYGRAIYGRQWQTNLAEGLGINDRSVRRWLAGETTMPDGLRDSLRRLALAKMKELGKVIVELE